MTRNDKCDKIFKMWQNVIRHDKTWQNVKNIKIKTSLTKLETCDKMQQVWQNVKSVTECDNCKTKN